MQDTSSPSWENTELHPEYLDTLRAWLSNDRDKLTPDALLEDGGGIALCPLCARELIRKEIGVTYYKASSGTWDDSRTDETYHLCEYYERDSYCLVGNSDDSMSFGSNRFVMYDFVYPHEVPKDKLLTIAIMEDLFHYEKQFIAELLSHG